MITCLFLRQSRDDILRRNSRFGTRSPRLQELHMSSITIDSSQLKTLLKQALIELLQEKDETLYGALAELVEEVGLVRAIQEGRDSETVDRERVFKALERES